MSSKENIAIFQLFERLECRYALRVLWALRDGHPQTFRLLQDSVGGITPNTLNTRIKELREVGLIDHGSDGYAVTASGSDLLKRLSDVQAFANRWAQAAPKIGHTPGPETGDILKIGFQRNTIKRWKLLFYSKQKEPAMAFTTTASDCNTKTPPWATAPRQPRASRSPCTTPAGFTTMACGAPSSTPAATAMPLRVWPGRGHGHQGWDEGVQGMKIGGQRT